MTLQIVPRQQWGARAPKRDIPNLAYPVSDVFQHHEAGAPFTSLDMNTEIARMREIQAFTMDSRGYTDFPYGFCVFPSGRAYEGRDVGWVGGGSDDQEAATLGHNANSIAILWPGNLDVQPVTPAQVQATADLLGLAVLAGRVRTPFAYRPHSAVVSTDCPGAHGRAALPAVMTAYTAAHTHHPTPITEADMPLNDADMKKIAEVVDNRVESALTAYFANGEGKPDGGRIYQTVVLALRNLGLAK